MRILYVSWYFPPTNTIAARRTGKMVERFLELGATVQVLTSVKHAENVNLPKETIRTVPFYDLDQTINPADFLRRLKRSSTQKIKENPTPEARYEKAYKKNPIWEGLRQLYTYGALFPDKHVGWRRHLKPALHQAIKTFKPDLIYVSAPPHSQILHVADVAKKTDIPWVAEFRDLWADEPFPQAPTWRRKLDKIVERRALKSAKAIVTISDPWGIHYKETYPTKPVHVTMNGFDPKDFTFEIERPAPSQRLEIIYAGALYPGRRDPSPLFEAIQKAGLSPKQVRVTFYTDYNDVVHNLAEKFNVANHLSLLTPTDYQTILRVQKASDILLLLQWIDPRNDGNVPAKVFEQLALRRPILGIGPLNGVPAHFIKERNAGLVATEHKIIAEQLQKWCLQKEETGRIEMLPADTAKGFERDTQFDKLYNFLSTLNETV